MTKKIKIIQIIPTLDTGGAERLLVDLVNGLDWSRFEIKVICLKRFGRLSLELKARGVELFLIGQKHKFSPFSLLKLINILRAEQPDIVHTHLFGADIYGRLAAKLAGVKHILSTEHNLNKSEGKLKKLFKKLTFKYGTAAVAVSYSVKKYMINHEGAAADRIKIIHNGVEAEEFLSAPADRKKNKIIIGAMGRLTRQKNFFVLIEALNLIKDREFECLIAGEGELKTDLEKQIKKLNLENKVKLIGIQKDAAAYLSSLDIFVMPSLWEGLGLAALEAGLAELPVIATEVDGLAEIIESKKNGLLVKPADARELSRAIVYLIDNAAERSRLGRNLREKVRLDFSLKNMVNQYEKLYLNLYNYENFAD